METPNVNPSTSPGEMEGVRRQALMRASSTLPDTPISIDQATKRITATNRVFSNDVTADTVDSTGGVTEYPIRFRQEISATNASDPGTLLWHLDLDNTITQASDLFKRFMHFTLEGIYITFNPSQGITDSSGLYSIAHFADPNNVAGTDNAQNFALINQTLKSTTFMSRSQLTMKFENWDIMQGVYGRYRFTKSSGNKRETSFGQLAVVLVAPTDANGGMRGNLTVSFMIKFMNRFAVTSTVPISAVVPNNYLISNGSSFDPNITILDGSSYLLNLNYLLGPRVPTAVVKLVSDPCCQLIATIADKDSSIKYHITLASTYDGAIVDVDNVSVLSLYLSIPTAQLAAIGTPFVESISMEKMHGIYTYFVPASHSALNVDKLPQTIHAFTSNVNKLRITALAKSVLNTRYRKNITSTEDNLHSKMKKFGAGK